MHIVVELVETDDSMIRPRGQAGNRIERNGRAAVGNLDHLSPHPIECPAQMRIFVHARPIIFARRLPVFFRLRDLRPLVEPFVSFVRRCIRKFLVDAKARFGQPVRRLLGLVPQQCIHPAIGQIGSTSPFPIGCNRHENQRDRFFLGNRLDLLEIRRVAIDHGVDLFRGHSDIFDDPRLGQSEVVGGQIVTCQGRHLRFLPKGAVREAKHVGLPEEVLGPGQNIRASFRVFLRVGLEKLVVPRVDDESIGRVVPCRFGRQQGHLLRGQRDNPEVDDFDPAIGKRRA